MRLPVRQAAAALTPLLEILAETCSFDEYIAISLKNFVQQTGSRGGGLWLADVTHQVMRPYAKFSPFSSEGFGNSIERPSADFDAVPYADVDQRIFTRLRPFMVRRKDMGACGFYQPFIDTFSPTDLSSVLVAPIFTNSVCAGAYTARSAGHAVSAEGRWIAYLIARLTAIAFRISRLQDESKFNSLLEERAGVTRLVHDSIAQNLTGVIMHVEAGLRATGEPQHEHLEEALSAARTGVSDARRSVNMVSMPAGQTLKARLEQALRLVFAASAESFTIELDGTIPLLRASTNNHITNLVRMVGERVAQTSERGVFSVVIEQQLHTILLKMRATEVNLKVMIESDFHLKQAVTAIVTELEFTENRLPTSTDGVIEWLMPKERHVR